MNRRQFLGGLLSLPLVSVFAKRSEASTPPVQSGSTPPREAVGLSKREARERLRAALFESGDVIFMDSDGYVRKAASRGEVGDLRAIGFANAPFTAPKGDLE